MATKRHPGGDNVLLMPQKRDLLDEGMARMQKASKAFNCFMAMVGDATVPFGGGEIYCLLEPVESEMTEALACLKMGLEDAGIGEPGGDVVGQ
ncbi:MAG: hypothetical protein H7A16_09595 [Sinobacteraceae bacterium]|nr:hypothetical protein [Nevskiaceae bacterium]